MLRNLSVSPILKLPVSCKPTISPGYEISTISFFSAKNAFGLENFKLLFENKNLTDNVNYNNFNKIFDNIGYTDFLFTKK